MSERNEITVQSWNELNDQLYDGDWDERLHRHRPSLVFRGQADARCGLQTALLSLGAADDVEEHLIRNFRKYARREGADHESLWLWLALGQHHGLPTRLLDWTHSPLVALHFAVSDLGACDALVWSIDYRKTNRFLPDKLKRVLEAEGSDVFTIEMIEQVAKNLGEWDALSREDFVVFWEPPSLDERMVNQYAVFSLVSNRHAHLHDWLREHPDCYRRLRIPAEFKWEVRDRLDQVNMTERMLFPDLDGLCRWLKRYYSPRPGGGHG